MSEDETYANLGLSLVQPYLDAAMDERDELGFDHPGEFGVSGTVKGNTLATARSDPPRICVNFSKWSEECEGLDCVIGPFFRHELDHIAFFTLPVYQTHCQKAAMLTWHEKQLAARKISRTQYYATRREYQKSLSEIGALLESRAHFFDFIAENNWDCADYAKVKRQILKEFREFYTQDIFEGITAVGQVHHADGWKRTITQQANDSIDALTEAFLHPDRFARARQARTVDEYLELCV